MSDAALVLAVALVSAAAVAVVWLRQRSAAAIRAESRDERDNGIVAQLRRRVEECEAVASKARLDTSTFIANHSRPR